MARGSKGEQWPLKPLFWVFLLLSSWPGCDSQRPPPGDEVLRAPEEPTNENARPGPVVVFLGNSITAGKGVGRDQAFPALLHRQLSAEGLGFRAVNAGVSGDTTAGGGARLDWLLRQKPDLLVIELGGNDALRGQPLSSIEKNLSQIIKRARALPSQVLLLGMRIPPSYGDDYANSFAAIYSRLAEENKIAFVPFFMKPIAGIRDLNLPDGIHPNARGHELLAENLLDTLRELLFNLMERPRGALRITETE